MIFWISKQIASLFGFDITKVQKAVLLAVGILILLAILASGLWLRSCFRKEHRLDEKTIAAAQTAIASQEREKMVEVLTAIEVEEKQIDETTATAEAEKFAAIKNAQERANGLSNEALARALEEKLNK